jgi:SAM-dependent methyltransferase
MDYTSHIADAYIDMRETYDVTDPIKFWVIEKIGLEGKMVLDFGCGDGRHTEILASMGADRVVGVDISKAMVEKALKRSEKSQESFEVIEADGAKLPFEDASFDVVFSNYVLQHFSELQQPLKEIYRVLKPGGMYIGMMGAMKVKDGSEDLCGLEVPVLLGGGDTPMRVHDLLTSEQEIRRAFDEVGLELGICKDIPNKPVKIDPEYERSGEIEKHLSLLCIASR